MISTCESVFNKILLAFENSFFVIAPSLNKLFNWVNSSAILAAFALTLNKRLRKIINKSFFILFIKKVKLCSFGFFLHYKDLLTVSYVCQEMLRNGIRLMIKGKLTPDSGLMSPAVN